MPFSTKRFPLHFNPHAPGGARRYTDHSPVQMYYISIHTPRVGRDVNARQQRLEKRISIHTPRVGRDCFQIDRLHKVIAFQSTRPGWGATKQHGCYIDAGKFQSTRPGWGDPNGVIGIFARCISIHTPRVGRDQSGQAHELSDSVFQSTRPGWARPDSKGYVCVALFISIHTPRVGRDVILPKYGILVANFNPHAPGGARPIIASKGSLMPDFNPHAPGGARPLSACSWVICC